MTREQFATVRVGQKVKVVGNYAGHYYRVGGVYPIERKTGDKAYLKTAEMRGGERVCNLFCDYRDIELYAMTRNAEMKELVEANKELESKIAMNNARIVWLKTYKDNLDETLQNVAKTIGLEDKTLLKKIYTELKKEGLDPNFDKLVVGTPVPATVGAPISLATSTVTSAQPPMLQDVDMEDFGDMSEGE